MKYLFPLSLIIAGLTASNTVFSMYSDTTPLLKVQTPSNHSISSSPSSSQDNFLITNLYCAAKKVSVKELETILYENPTAFGSYTLNKAHAYVQRASYNYTGPHTLKCFETFFCKERFEANKKACAAMLEKRLENSLPSPYENKSFDLTSAKKED